MFHCINKQAKSYWYFHAAVNFKVIGLCWLLRIVGCYFSPSGTSSKISGLVDPSNTLHLNISPSPYCLPSLTWHPHFSHPILPGQENISPCPSLGKFPSGRPLSVMGGGGVGGTHITDIFHDWGFWTLPFDIAVDSVLARVFWLHSRSSSSSRNHVF